MNRFSILLPLAAIMTSASGQGQDVTNLTSSQFKDKISSGTITLLDVRTSSEYANGHIKNARQMNYYVLDFRKKLLLLPKDHPVFLYCNTGWRSKKSAEILAENGYNQVYNLEKGIMDWNLSNLPVVIEPGAKPDEENKIEPDEFYALINSDDPVFINFYAPWCPPCRKMIPLIDSLQTEYKNQVRIVKINADASKNLVKELHVGNVPYFTFYKSGNKLFEHYGILDRKAIERVLSNP